MNVKVNRNMRAAGKGMIAGQVYSVPDDVGKFIIRHRWGVVCDKPKGKPKGK